MSIYFSTHKKKKNFPFALFGFLVLLVWTGMAVYLMQKGYSISDFASAGSDSEIKNIIGFVIIVSSFLLYFLSLGIVRELKVRFKFPLYAFQFIFLAMSAISGYFLSSYIFPDLVNYLIICAALYYITLLAYFLLQHRIYSRYFSKTIMIISSLPLIPFLYGVYVFISGKSLVFSAQPFAFDNLVIYILLFTLLLYTSANSVYLSYINRRVY